MVSFCKKIILLPFYLFYNLGNFYSLTLFFFKNKNYSKWFDLCNREISKKFITVVHNFRDKKIFLKFYTPNSRCKGRVETFSSKEPETLCWIDRQLNKGIFFDVGANIGLYSIYYAKIKGGKVYSFEPSVYNLEQLSKNINLNKLQKNITIISNPLHNKNKISKLIYNNIDKGGSEVFFDSKTDIKERSKKEHFSYLSLGLSLDYLTEKGLIELPNCIKLDVDGNEKLIISGSKKTLLNKRCRSILVESNALNDLNLISKILRNYGFKYNSKSSSNANKVFDKF
jgi:FkbM family methyltransferase